MIWDTLVSIGSKHPVVMRGIVGTVAMVVFGYIVLSGLSTALIEGQRQGCERGNDTRIAEKTEKEELIGAVERKRGALEVKGEHALALALSEEAGAYRGKIEFMIDLAEDSGNENGKGSVTINCIKEYPQPLTLPWINEGP